MRDRVRERFLKIFLVVSVLIASSMSYAWGASVTLTAANAGSYILEGDNFQGVASGELTIVFNGISPSEPQVTTGNFLAGTLMVSHWDAGRLRLAFIATNPLYGGGLLAEIVVATSGSDTSRTPRLFVELSDANGNLQQPRTEVVVPWSVPPEENSTP